MKHYRKIAVLALAVVLAMLCSATAFAEHDVYTDPNAPETEESSSWGLLSGESLKEAFMVLFTGAISDFFSEIVNALVGMVDGLLLDILAVVFHAENLVSERNTTVLSAQSLHNTYNFIYAVACALVTLKFLFKGFQIYVLWRDGDADSSPRDMLVGAIEAVIVMVSFPWLYERAVDVCIYLANGIMGTLGGASFHTNLAAISPSSSSWAVLVIMLILALIFFILLFVLWIRLIRQGLELLIMRLGLPLATLGLIDSDAALFKNYIQVFIKTALTVIIQITLMAVTFRIVQSFDIRNLLIGIAFMATALSSPKLMQQFLVPSGGGGAMQKASSIAMFARTCKMFIA